MYLIEDYNGSNDYAELMKDAPVDIILGAMVFFYTLGSELLNDTMDYLQAQKLEQLEITQGNNNSQINMDGINQSMESLKEISQNLIWSPSFHYTSV